MRSSNLRQPIAELLKLGETLLLKEEQPLLTFPGAYHDYDLTNSGP